MVSTFALAHAVGVLRDGGVIAYPTEGVFGLGCSPNRADAVGRILELKGRDASKGLILIAGRPGELAGWADFDALPADPPKHPVTWIVPAGALAYPALTGGRETIAIRITTHPVASRLATLAGVPLVSTSANLSGRAAARNRIALRRAFRDRLDLIVPGSLGQARGPSEIRDLASGRIVRPLE